MKSQSVEKQARKALRRMVFWRIVAELLFLPQAVILGILAVFARVLDWLKTLEMTLFYLELDAARRYTLLTGVDLAASSGAPARYGPLLNPDLTDSATRGFISAHLPSEEEDDE